MSKKKFRKSLEAMDADQVAAKLGDYYEKLDGIRTDKKLGTIKTIFNSSRLVRKERADILETVAAEKNRVAGVEHTLLPQAIASAAETRGSKSADKIRKHIELDAKAEKVAKESLDNTLNPLKIIKTGFAAYKNLG